jgi:hypothetical protein
LGPNLLRDKKKPPRLLAEAQLGDDCPVPLYVNFVEVSELPTALSDHLQEAASRVVVFTVAAQVLRKVIDPFREQSNLHLGGACVRRVLLVFLNDFGSTLCRCREHLGLSGPRIFLLLISSEV